jgi:hypothetical protein
MGFTFNNRELVVNVDVGTVQTADGLAVATPTGKCPVVNLYVDPMTGRLIVEYDDQPVT